MKTSKRNYLFLVVLATTVTLHLVFAMRLDTPPFDNNDVRLALKYAAKMQEMVDKILLGYGEIGNDHSISPNQAYFNTDLPQREFDAEKEKRYETYKNILKDLKDKNSSIKALAYQLYENNGVIKSCLLYTSPSPRDRQKSRMPSSA